MSAARDVYIISEACGHIQWKVGTQPAKIMLAATNGRWQSYCWFAVSIGPIVHWEHQHHHHHHRHHHRHRHRHHHIIAIVIIIIITVG